MKAVSIYRRIHLSQKMLLWRRFVHSYQFNRVPIHFAIKT